MLTAISTPPVLYTGFIDDSMSRRVWAVGTGMLETQMMMDENRTTVMARIRIVPMTSDTPRVAGGGPDGIARKPPPRAAAEDSHLPSHGVGRPTGAATPRGH